MQWTLRTWIWLALGATVVLVAVMVRLSGRQPVPRVGVVEAVRENLNATVSSNGKVEPITPYSIRARLETFVTQVYTVEGQAVKRGQLLLTLDVEDARSNLARAREELVAAEDNLSAARSGGRADALAQLQSDLRKADLERTRLRQEYDALQRLVAQQAATKEEVDRSRSALEGAEADWQRLQKTRAEFERRAKLDVERATLQVNRFRDEVRALEEKVRQGRVTAPVDGTLYSLPVRQRDFVKTGDLLAEMADLRQVRVRAFIDEPELGGLEPNQAVDIIWDAFPSQVWHGRTEQIPKQVVARGTRSVGEVLCSVSNERLELLPNINVDVHIHLRERTNVLTIPRGAVQIEGMHRYVFAVQDGGLRSRLQRREIKVGIASATKYEVLAGLREHERMALPGEVELRDGMAVNVAERE
ncbi:MAG TPA: efflux RND transporter periplasmic adaptor subunit [Candidatus Acidoferrales bacterium]|jgi:HlyD family secretion protein|nr:efflux RND transporter periplasmic adaptor subunit [Candidatus Acidoferrales bacterium]